VFDLDRDVAEQVERASRFGDFDDTAFREPAPRPVAGQRAAK